jgi:hypothetical protein
MRIRKLRAACGQSPQERVAEDLSGLPHGMLTTHEDVLNPDLFSFIRA